MPGNKDNLVWIGYDAIKIIDAMKSLLPGPTLWDPIDLTAHEFSRPE